MSRNAALSQTRRNFQNPLVLGTFSTTTLRYLKGTLKQEYKVIGSADTAFTSNGGYGGGTYNHWFQINLAKPAWIIVTKGPPRPQYIQVSAYDLNRTPILAQPIFDADSITDGINRTGGVYIPYLDTVMHGQSDLYNTYNRWRLDRGDDRYYPLSEGSYLICVSSTRNEPLEYEVGIVIEFPPTQMFIALEDEGEVSLLLQETAIDFARTINVECPVTTDLTIGSVPEQPNGFTETLCQINSGVTVTVLEGSTWLIGEQIPSAQEPEYAFLAEPASDEYFDTIHDHSLSEWKDAWNSQHQDTDRFPEIFAPLTNRD
jgi:hypothetical protein